MRGVWSETWTPRVCPNCAHMGKPDSRLFHMVTDTDGLSILQARCHICKYVETKATSVSGDALKALRTSHRRARVFATIAVGELIALGALMLGASALAAMR